MCKTKGKPFDRTTAEGDPVTRDFEKTAGRVNSQGPRQLGGRLLLLLGGIRGSWNDKYRLEKAF